MKIFSVDVQKMLTAALFGLVASAGASAAQEATLTESSTDWAIYVVENPKECFIVSAPTTWRAERGGQAVDVRRSDIRFYVSVIPSENIANEPSFMAGYPLRNDGTVELRIGSSSFALYPNPDINPEYAWSKPEDDGALITAMRGGSEALVTGVSQRGTTTFDTFSLIGFTAAFERATELCAS
ncbi:MAG: invasion associated locus B family protein [Paracoccaceae bacterium]